MVAVRMGVNIHLRGIAELLKESVDDQGPGELEER
jgi:hypothetical protein